MAFIGIRAAVIPREERLLQARFGASYDQYISRTGALCPDTCGDREGSA